MDLVSPHGIVPSSLLFASVIGQHVFTKLPIIIFRICSGICDGASAVILASEEAVKQHNLTPLARIVGYGLSGCEPTIMGFGPVPAIRY